MNRHMLARHGLEALTCCFVIAVRRGVDPSVDYASAAESVRVLGRFCTRSVGCRHVPSKHTLHETYACPRAISSHMRRRVRTSASSRVVVETMGDAVGVRGERVEASTYCLPCLPSIASLLAGPPPALAHVLTGGHKWTRRTLVTVSVVTASSVGDVRRPARAEMQGCSTSGSHSALGVTPALVFERASG